MNSNSSEGLVDDDLSKTLDKVTGLDSGKSTKVKEIEAEARANEFEECTWYNACYYCKDALGRWRLIRCIA